MTSRTMRISYMEIFVAQVAQPLPISALSRPASLLVH